MCVGEGNGEFMLGNRVSFPRVLYFHFHLCLYLSASEHGLELEIHDGGGFWKGFEDEGENPRLRHACFIRGRLPAGYLRPARDKCCPSGALAVEVSAPSVWGRDGSVVPSLPSHPSRGLARPRSDTSTLPPPSHRTRTKAFCRPRFKLVVGLKLTLSTIC